MPEYALSKKYLNHFGLDLKSNDLTRPEEFASGVLNAQYRKNGALEKRKGYQGHAASQGGHGLFTYNRINPTTSVAEPEVISVSDKLHKLVQSTMTVTYVGADPTALISIFFDTATDQYRCQILEGTSTVLDQALGIGFDEASPYTINSLKTAIDALANFTATLTGATTTPAAFIKIVRNHSLTDSALSATACYWQDVNKTVSAPFAGSLSNDDDEDFENVTAIQLQNVMYLTNGYDEVQKYDGQTVYRAGMPKPASITSALGGAGAITGSNYYHVANYIQVDAVGNITEGNELRTSSGLAPAAQSINVTVANIQASTGFNTNCAIVNGAQVAVNTITVDNGSGGAHTMQVGDTAYFFDSVSGFYVERLVTAIAATTITVAGAAVTVADNAVISNNLRIGLYRNQTSGTTPSVFYLVAEIPNNSFAATQVYNDNLTDAQLGAEFIAPIVDRSVPPKAKYISAFRNQIVLCGDITAPNRVYYSDVDSPEHFPAGVNTFDVETVAGDTITGCAPNNELFAIFKKHSIFMVSGNIADNTIRVDLLSQDIGCAAHATIQEVRGSLFFLSNKGPYFMTGGQIPAPLGGNRIEPEFSATPITSEFELVPKRAVGIHDRKEERYLLFVPTESRPANRYTNSNAKLYCFDYTRDAWLIWSNMDLTGGATILEDEFYFSERRLSSFTSNVEHILYRRHTLDDAWSYQDNASPVSFNYKTQWEALGEPSVFKNFNQLRVFALEDVPNNSLTLNVSVDVNYIKDTPKAEFEIDFSGTGYGVSAYGTAPYGDPAEQVTKKKLMNGKFRSMRLVFENELDQQNVALTGWELEIAAPYKPKFKT